MKEALTLRAAASDRLGRGGLEWVGTGGEPLGDRPEEGSSEQSVRKVTTIMIQVLVIIDIGVWSDVKETIRENKNQPDDEHCCQCNTAVNIGFGL